MTIQFPRQSLRLRGGQYVCWQFDHCSCRSSFSDPIKCVVGFGTHCVIISHSAQLLSIPYVSSNESSLQIKVPKRDQTVRVAFCYKWCWNSEDTMHDTLTATLLAALLVLSAGSAVALTTGAYEDVTESRIVATGTNIQQQPSQVLVFADDYTPEPSFEVVTRLKQGAVRDILGQTVNDRPIISDTSDFSGYLVQLQSSGDVPGEYGIVFVDRNDGRLVTGTQYQFETDATFFMVDANLLQSGITSASGDTTPEEETTPTEEGTPTLTPENETPTRTPEEGTPTPEEGMATPTPEEGTPTPMPEADGVDENETTTVGEETPEAVAAGETTTAAEAGEDGGLISSIADFLGGLFGGGGDEGAQQTTTVEGGGAG